FHVTGVQTCALPISAPTVWCGGSSSGRRPLLGAIAGWVVRTVMRRQPILDAETRSGSSIGADQPGYASPSDTTAIRHGSCWTRHLFGIWIIARRHLHP